MHVVDSCPTLEHNKLHLSFAGEDTLLKGIENEIAESDEVEAINDVPENLPCDESKVDVKNDDVLKDNGGEKLQDEEELIKKGKQWMLS